MKSLNCRRIKKPADVADYLSTFALFFVLVLAFGAVSNAQTEPVRFAVIGDFGSGNSDQGDVANLVKSWNPNFIVTTGDNNYPDGEASTIDENIGQFYHEFISPYLGSYGPGATENRFFPSLGNHDWETPGAQPYLDYFTLPGNERYYDFVRGPVHFFVIDSDNREPSGNTETSVQGLWLRDRLAASTAPWKIVVVHHTPFCSRTSTARLQWPYQQWGASAVLAGHAHIYERVMRSGFPYITNGLGGESLGTFGTPISGSAVRFGSNFGAQLITATNSTINMKFITRANVVIDEFIMTTVVPATASGLTATAASSSRVNLTWTDNADNEDGYSVERCQGASCTNFAEIVQLPRDTAAYMDTGRSAETSYRYRVRGFNSLGSAAYSNTASVTMPQLPPVPGSPSNLTATAVSSSQINLAWTDGSSNEEGFRIERCAGAGCSNFSQVAQTGANATSFNNSGLAADTAYVYRVRAYNDGGNSGYTNTAQASTAPSATSVLSDNFDDGVRDPAKWTLGLFSRNSSYFDSQIQTVEQNGRLSITPRASITGNHYSGYISVATWNLTDSIASVEVAQKASGNAVTIFSMGTDKDNWYGFRAKNNSLLLEYRRNSSTTTITLSYNAAQHRFWRLRHDASADAVTFETSPDATNWTTHRTVARQFAITAMKIELVAGTGESISNPGTALFDNFMLNMNNAPPDPPQAPSGLTAEAAAHDQVNLAWTDNSDDEDSFKIERCSGTGCINFTQISQVGMNVTTFADSTVAGATIYRYRVRAFNSGADSDYSNLVEATTPPVPAIPEAPSNLVATAASSSQINLTWSVNSATEEGFDIERCTGIGCTNFVEIAEVGVDVSSFSDTGLAASTVYTYRVRAFNAAGVSPYSNVAGVSTNGNPGGPPLPPSNLAATAASAAVINLSWTDGSSDETNFKIERCQGSGCTNFTEIAQTAANVASFTDTGLSASTLYRYRVRASNGSGNSAYSNIAQTTTSTPPPNAPSGLTATPQSSSQVDLAWTDNSGNEEGFKIERCQDTGCSSFAEIAQVGAGITVYQDTGRSPSTTYVYRVRAFIGTNDSAYSNIANATTPAAPGVPAAPSGLTVASSSASWVNIAWTDNSSDETGFKVERCQNVGCSNFIEIFQTGPNIVVYADNTVAADTVYNYRVRAFSSGGNSAYSNTVTANTGSGFADDFADGTRDATKWNLGLLSLAAGGFDSAVSVSEQNGRLVIGPRPGVSGIHYNGYVSVAPWNFTNSFASVTVVQKAALNAQTLFSIGTDESNFYRLRSRGSTFFMEVSIAGTVSTLSIAASNSPRVWRIRHNPASDSIIFETSADDGATWVVRRTLARQIPITALKIEIIAGTSESVSAPGSALLDNFRFAANGTP